MDLDPSLIVPGPSVDTDGVAGLDKDRDLDDEPGLRDGRLARARLGVAPLLTTSSQYLAIA